MELSRDWYWLAVAIVPKSGRLEASGSAPLSGDDFQPVLYDWHDAGIDVLVWDHQGLQTVATPMPTILQPAVSLELNPTERVGELLRAAVEVRNYTALWRKMLAMESVLHELQADWHRVKQLTGYPWILETLKELLW